jgi:hypothetical protein
MKSQYLWVTMHCFHGITLHYINQPNYINHQMLFTNTNNSTINIIMYSISFASSCVYLNYYIVIFKFVPRQIQNRSISTRAKYNA